MAAQNRPEDCNADKLLYRLTVARYRNTPFGVKLPVLVTYSASNTFLAKTVSV